MPKTENIERCRLCRKREGVFFGRAYVCKPCIRVQGLRRIHFAFLDGFGEMEAEANLMYEVIKQSVKDIRGTKVDAKDKGSALRHLRGPMLQAQLVGIDPEWIRQTLKNYYLVDVTKPIKEAAL